MSALGNQELISRYKIISQHLSLEFENDTQQEIYLNGVLDKLVEDIAQVSQCPESSPVVVTLLTKSNLCQTEILLSAIIADLQVLVSNEYSYRVVQSALYRCSHFLHDVKQAGRLIQLINQAMEVLLERSELITHIHSNHVMRTLIEVMYGMELSKHIVTGQYSEAEESYMKEHNSCGIFESSLNKLSAMIFPSSSMAERLRHPYLSIMAQMFLFCFRRKNHKMRKTVCQSILSSDIFTKKDGNGCPVIFTDRYSSFFLMAMVRVLDKSEYSHLINDVICLHSQQMISDYYGLLLFQTVIDYAQTVAQLSSILELVEGKLFSLYEQNKGGILLAMLSSYSKFSRASTVLQSLLKEVGYEDQQNTAKFLIALTLGTKSHIPTDEQLSKELSNIKYTPSMIIKYMLFSDKKHRAYLCSSLTSLIPQHITHLMASENCSKVFETFFNSETEPPVSKTKLANRLHKLSAHLLKSERGSRLLLLFWKHMGASSKVSVMQSLVVIHSRGDLLGNKFGQVVAFRVRLLDYMQNRNMWDHWIACDNSLSSFNIDIPIDVNTTPKSKDVAPVVQQIKTITPSVQGISVVNMTSKSNNKKRKNKSLTPTNKRQCMKSPLQSV